jgi:GR25 family glycosyltransferase involved in LPS biosynthesis
MNENILETIKKNKNKKIQFISELLDNYKVHFTSFKRDEERKSILNRFSEKIYVINLKNDVIRRNYIKVLFEKLNITYTLVVVEPISDEVYSILDGNKKQLSKSEVGCSLSHLWCLKHIIQNEYKGGAIVFEDDIVVHKNFENMFEELFREKQYDFLSMGGCDFDFSTMNYKNVKNKLYQPSLNSTRCYGAHANYYSFEGAKYVFKIKSLFFSFFDNNFSYIFKHFNNSAFITCPNLFVTDLTNSNINHNYYFCSSQEEYFYSNCFIDFQYKNYRFLYLSIIKKVFEKYKTMNPVIEVDETNIHKFLHYVLNDENMEEEKRIEIIKRLDLEFFTCKDILAVGANNSKKSL